MIHYAVRTPPAITGNFEPLPVFRVSDHPSIFIAEKKLRGVGRCLLQNEAYREGYKLFESELEAYRYWLKESEALNDLTNWSGEDKYSGAAYQEAGERRPIPLGRELLDYPSPHTATTPIGVATRDADPGEYVSVALSAGAGARWGWDEEGIREAARSRDRNPVPLSTIEAIERNADQRPIVINMVGPSPSMKEKLASEEFRKRVIGEWTRDRNGSVFQEDPRSFQWFRDDAIRRGSLASHNPIIEPIPESQAQPGEKPDGMTYYIIRCESCGSRRRLAAPNAEAVWIVQRALKRAANEMRQERCG